MGDYLKLFETHAEYEAYITGSDKILPNVSYCVDNNDVHYNPWTDPRLIVKYNVTSTDSATKLCYSTSSFSEIEIDGVVQTNLVTSYTFETTGEHTVKYTLVNTERIYNNAFKECTSITNVSMPNSVTSIGNYSFGGCTSLINVTLSNNMTTIETNSFRDCISLTNIVIPDTVTTIGNQIFWGCTSLINVIIGGSITSMGNSVFNSCTSLTSITIPSSVTSIGYSAFENCTSLESITSQATTAPTIQANTFRDVKIGGTLYVPSGSTGYNVWMGNGDYYLGKYNWTKVEQ